MFLYPIEQIPDQGNAQRTKSLKNEALISKENIQSWKYTTT